MTSSFLPQRLMTVLLATTALVACSSDGPIPPASIDGGTRVGSISQDRRVTVRRTGDRLEGRVGGPPASFAADAPESEAMALSNGTGDIDYNETPNLAGTGEGSETTIARQQDLPMIDSPEALGETQATSPPQQQMARRTSDLPMIDSPEAPAQAGVAGDEAPSGPLLIPEGGVDMDAELGVGGAQDSAVQSQTGELSIAEGATDQPVVDGIGSDAPLLVPGASRQVP